MSAALPAQTARRIATTPGRMMAALAIVAALAVASGATALFVFADVREAVRTIGYDAEPSVVAAQVLGANLAGMDAAALADALTEDGASSGTSRAFADHLAIVNATLVKASQNITYGETEAGPIRALVGHLENYLTSLAEGRWMAGGNPVLAVRRARWSSRLLNDFALPDAAALERANLGPLESIYVAYRSSSLALAGVAMAALAIFLASLVATQLFLSRRTRRVVNLPLAAATVLTALAMVGFGAAMLSEQADTRAAKEDAFDSIHALYGAKVAAYELTAERSLWLLDPAGRAESGARFSTNVHRLLGIDADDVKASSAAIDALARALEIERSGRPDDAIKATPKLGGLLGAELDNITFGPAERQPATDAVVALLNYLQADANVRREEEARRHVAAVTMATSARGGAPAAFAALDDALDRTIAVNETEFRLRTDAAMSLLGWLPLGICGTLLVALGLAGAGVWQRWREYR
jgi:hypothetical protein